LERAHPERIDTLIHARWVVPIEPAGLILDHHAVALRDGRIVAVLPSADAAARFSAERTLHRDQHVLMPGLVNAHTHLAMSLLRGLADDLPLERWLGENIWPVEARWVSQDFVRDGAGLALAECIRGGVTCVNDMYFFPDATARVALDAGLRASLGLVVLDFPTAWAASPDEYLAKGSAVRDAHANDALLSFMFAPHAPYSVSDASFERIRVRAAELETRVHCHVHETATEVAAAAAKDGRRPLARLDALGLLGPDLLAVHMTQLTDAEVALCAERGVSVAHCPESNLKLASGECRVADLQAAGVCVALGTDGAASNNDLDMFGEMRSAALLAKAVAEDPTVLPAHAALRMATLDGARALGLEAAIGSLEPGKWADMIAVDLGGLEQQPVYDAASTLVYATSRERVTDCWVAGQPLMRDRALLTLDESALIARAQEWRARIRPA
jgi:5-methylthioadenosine/S-adenosylhomocysteine deaminase